MSSLSKWMQLSHFEHLQYNHATKHPNPTSTYLKVLVSVLVECHSEISEPHVLLLINVLEKSKRGNAYETIHMKFRSVRLKFFHVVSKRLPLPTTQVETPIRKIQGGIEAFFLGVYIYLYSFLSSTENLDASSSRVGTNVYAFHYRTYTSIPTWCF